MSGRLLATLAPRKDDSEKPSERGGKPQAPLVIVSSGTPPKADRGKSPDRGDIREGLQKLSQSARDILSQGGKKAADPSSKGKKRMKDSQTAEERMKRKMRKLEKEGRARRPQADTLQFRPRDKEVLEVTVTPNVLPEAHDLESSSTSMGAILRKMENMGAKYNLFGDKEGGRLDPEEALRKKMRSFEAELTAGGQELVPMKEVPGVAEKEVADALLEVRLAEEKEVAERRAEEEEAAQRFAEEEAQWRAEKEAARLHAEEKEAKRLAEEAAARQDREEAARRLVEEEAKELAAGKEDARRSAEAEAAKRLAEEEENARRSAEAEAAKRLAEEEENARRSAQAEAARRLAEEEETARRRAADSAKGRSEAAKKQAAKFSDEAERQTAKFIAIKGEASRQQASLSSRQGKPELYRRRSESLFISADESLLSKGELVARKKEIAKVWKEQQKLMDRGGRSFIPAVRREGEILFRSLRDFAFLY